MRTALFTLAILFFTNGLYAQSELKSDSALEVRKKSVAYFFNLQVGTLVGCRECDLGKEISFTSSTVHGVTIKERLRVGAGIGFDSYFEWQTMPIFGSVSYDVLGKKNRLFVQAAYGWSDAWRTYKDREFGFAYDEGGKHLSAAVGYRVKYGDLRLSIAAGYKSQDVSAHYTYSFYSWPLRPNEPTSMQTTEERLKRVMVTLSVGWK